MNGDTPQVGGELEVRATLVLGGLDPDDVCVEVVLGLVNDDDELINPTTTELVPLPASDVVYPLVRFGGTVPLDRAGTCGYTVRIRPRHRLLTHPAEAGMAVVAEPTMGIGTLVPH